MLSKDQVSLNILQEGTTAISNILLSIYKKIGLSDTEMMLIIHLLYFQNKGNDFPSFSELEKRMTLNSEELMKVFQRLVKQGYIFIEENKDEETDILYEAYNVSPTLLKVIKELERNVEINKIEKDRKLHVVKVDNVYKIFEQEFGRPLSPIEIELISTWIDKDKYSEDVIIYALKEAVFSNKISFRYIDRILFDWQKKNIRTVDQVKQYIKNFRATQDLSRNTKPFKENNNFEFYNWLENE